MRTPPGRLFRRAANQWLEWNPFYADCSGIQLKFSNVTDIDVNWKAMKRGLGYDKNFCTRPPPRLLLDLGCNAGLFALWLAKNCGTISGLGIDAALEMVYKAKENFARNLGTKDRMQVIQGLIQGDRTEQRTFHTNESSFASGPIKIPATYGRYTGQTKITTIQVRPEWQARFGDQEPDLIKIDIEGSEYEWLSSLDGLSMCALAKRIVIEWHEPLSDLIFLRQQLPSHRLVSYHRHAWIGLAYFERLK